MDLTTLEAFFVDKNAGKLFETLISQCIVQEYYLCGALHALERKAQNKMPCPHQLTRFSPKDTMTELVHNFQSQYKIMRKEVNISLQKKDLVTHPLPDELHGNRKLLNSVVSFVVQQTVQDGSKGQIQISQDFDEAK